MFGKVSQGLFIAQLLFAIIACVCKISMATNTCCYFDDNECAWTNFGRTGAWTWSTDSTPDITSVTDYQSNTTPNEWLQDTSLATTVKTAVKASSPLKIDRNDVVSVKFYRHTPSGNTDDRLILRAQRTTGVTVTLLKAQNDGWQTLNITCSSGTCCANYPCFLQFQIQGILKSSSDLLAFDDFVINNCLVTTTPATVLPTTVTTTMYPLNLVTVKTTTVTVITTVTSTSYNQTTSTKPITTSDTRTTSKSNTAVIFRG